jgi:hypothetical protein
MKYYEQHSGLLPEETFLEYVKKERQNFTKAMSELWLAHNPQERVAIENLLIAYDQMVEREERIISPAADQDSPPVVSHSCTEGISIEQIVGSIEFKRACMEAAKKVASFSQDSVVFNDPKKYSLFRDGQQSAIEILQSLLNNQGDVAGIKK